MEKISSIVPRSRRVAAADLGTASAVRPGTPSFGRPVGTSTTGARDLQTTAQKAIIEQNKMQEQRRSSGMPSDLVREMSNRFFLQKTIEAPIIEMPEEVPGQSAPGSEDGGEVRSGAPEDSEGQESSEVTIEKPVAPKEYVPPGTYLNVSA